MHSKERAPLRAMPEVTSHNSFAEFNKRCKGKDGEDKSYHLRASQLYQVATSSCHDSHRSDQWNCMTSPCSSSVHALKSKRVSWSALSSPVKDGCSITQEAQSLAQQRSNCINPAQFSALWGGIAWPNLWGFIDLCSQAPCFSSLSGPQPWHGGCFIRSLLSSSSSSFSSSSV